jgi:hypothetical protein
MRAYLSISFVESFDQRWSGQAGWYAPTWIGSTLEKLRTDQVTVPFALSRAAIWVIFWAQSDIFIRRARHDFCPHACPHAEASHSAASLSRSQTSETGWRMRKKRQDDTK